MWTVQHKTLKGKLLLTALGMLISFIILIGITGLLVTAGYGYPKEFIMSPKMFYSMTSDYSKTINPLGATAQSYVETRGWTSELWRKGINGAGIKADKGWKEAGLPYVIINSPEWSENKGYYMKYSLFRAYDTPKSFIKDYSHKISSDYPRCTSDNVWGYLAGLYKGTKGQWATDHKYFQKVVKAVLKVSPGLDISKEHLRTSFEDAVRRNLLNQWQQRIVQENLL